MDNTQHESRELSAQELTEVSGGIFDPNRPKPAGDFDITGTGNLPTNDVNAGELIDEKLKGYSEKYGYPKLGNNSEG